jgi:hypothetical protein
MILKYDPDTSELKITIIHNVNNENDHFIYQIKIWKNDELFHTINYTSQPSREKFTYQEIVPADEDDVLEVTAYCNYGGDITTTLELEKGTEAETESPEIWPLHSLPMLLGFFFMITGIIIAKTLKKKDWWFKAHKYLNSVGSLLAIIGLTIAIYMVSESGSGHFRVPHAILGGITIFLLVLSPILGFLLMKGTENTEKLRPLHRWVGRIAIALMLIVILTGYSMVGVL